MTVPPDPAFDVRRITPASQRRLDGKLIRGVKWFGASRLAAQVITWVVSMAVARLLTPSDYGLIGMASVFLGALAIVGEFGIGSAVMAHPEFDRKDLASLHSLACLTGLGVAILGAVVAVPVARVFDEPALTWVVIVLALNLFLVALRTVPQAYMQRELRFRAVATVDLVQSVLQAAATLALAYWGFRYWSLLLGTLAASATYTGLLWIFSGIGFGDPRRESVRSAFVVIRNVLGARLAWYGFQNADFFVVGRWLGRHALGVYTIAWNLGLLPLEKLSALTSNLAPAIFSAARNDADLTRRYLLGMSAALLLVTLPPTVGIALVAPDLIQVALGPKYLESIVPLRLLSIYCAVRCLDPLWSQLLVIGGESRLVLRLNLVGLLVLPLAFVFASRWGTTGVAAAWIVAHPLIIVLPMLLRVSSRYGVTLRAQLTNAAPGLIACAAMVGTVLTCQQLLPADASPLVRLLAASGVGALTVASVLWFGFRERTMTLVRLLRQRELAPTADTRSA